MIKIITIATLKGGSGKSTLATVWRFTGSLRDAGPVPPLTQIPTLAGPIGGRDRRLGGVTVVEEPTEAAATIAREMAAKGRPSSD